MHREVIAHRGGYIVGMGFSIENQRKIKTKCTKNQPGSIAISSTTTITVTITIATPIEICRRTANFGANCWGGFSVHREVIAPHGGYVKAMDFLLQVEEKSNENVTKNQPGSIAN